MDFASVVILCCALLRQITDQKRTQGERTSEKEWGKERKSERQRE